MRLYVRKEPVLIFAHSEEICFLFFTAKGSSAVRADAAFRLRVRKERFARNAIPALVGAFINIALIIELFEDFLNGFDVIIVRCADEAVRIHTEKLPYFLYLR